MKATELIYAIVRLMDQFGDQDISIPLECRDGGYGPIAEIQNVTVEVDGENFYIWSKLQ